MLNRRWRIEMKDVLEFGLRHGDSCVTYEHLRDSLQAYQHQLRISLSSLTYRIRMDCATQTASLADAYVYTWM